MFFIVPIGSEEGVRRLPYVTIGLIMLNTIIWIIICMVPGGQTADLEQLNARMLEIESHYTYQLLAADPDLLNELDYEKVRDRILDGDIISVGTADFHLWKNLYNLAGFFEQYGRYEEAAKLYGLHIEIHRACSVRPKAIYRVHLLFKDKLSNTVMAQNALAYLHREYPGWIRG